MRKRSLMLIRTCLLLCLAIILAWAMAPVSAFAEERWCDENLQWKRVWGQNAYDTMEAIIDVDGRSVYKDGSVSTVIVATGDGYWDALSAAGVAGVNRCPIVVTPKDYLCDQARRELQRLKPSRVILAGGPMAVSHAVEAEIKDLLGIPMSSNIRAYGDKASDTAIALFKATDPTKWNVGLDHKYCIIATSNGYWDALSIAPLAFARGIPIFLTEYSQNSDYRVLSQATLDIMDVGGFDRFIIVGGPLAVSSMVPMQLSKLEQDGRSIEVMRWYGQTAIDTSAVIARHETEDFGMTVTHMMVATTNGYWDALTAAPVAGKLGTVLVLMDPLAAHPEAFSEVYDKDKVGTGYILGGQFAISEGAEGYIVARSLGYGPVG